jgi:hypothetical protein
MKIAVAAEGKFGLTTSGRRLIELFKLICVLGQVDENRLLGRWLRTSRKSSFEQVRLVRSEVNAELRALQERSERNALSNRPTVLYRVVIRSEPL